MKCNQRAPFLSKRLIGQLLKNYFLFFVFIVIGNFNFVFFYFSGIIKPWGLFSWPAIILVINVCSGKWLNREQVLTFVAKCVGISRWGFLLTCDEFYIASCCIHNLHNIHYFFLNRIFYQLSHTLIFMDFYVISNIIMPYINWSFFLSQTVLIWFYLFA